MKLLVRSVFFSLFVLTCSTQALADEDALRVGGSFVLGVLPKLAFEQGMFEEAQLSVEFTRIEVGKMAMDAVLSDKIDVGCIVATNLAVNSFNHSDLRVIAAIISDYDNGLVYRKDRGIGSISELRGKRVGYLPATTSHSFLLHHLEAVGLTFADIRPVVMQPLSMLPSLRAGAVDAVSIWNPWRERIIRSLGEEVGEVRNSEVYRPMGYLAVTERTIKEKPTELRALLRVLFRAEQFASQHPELVKKRFGAWNGLDDAAVEALWSPLRLRVDLLDDAVSSVESDIRLLRKNDVRFRTRSHRPAVSFFDIGPLSELDSARIGERLR
ncbi:MAG: NrtA/SsuA/CpmA family ABC transporter substrate-binding protein [Bdellovibrionales bacterium]|nr:NrtA/SsuA/CpmA family ABC transporter substrate-binding protein [Bdellovibrionales bacterium]